MRFYLGTHEVGWLWDTRLEHVPLFVSARRLTRRPVIMRRALTRWALDSGGFTELSMHGRWTVTTAEYVALVRRCHAEIGSLDWVAPQDWMCEPQILTLTGLTVAEHQQRTVENLLELRTLAPDVHFCPVLQGWCEADYLRCVELYQARGVELADEPVVGVGTMCRRQGTREAAQIMRRLAGCGLRLHAFGAKISGLTRYADVLHSSDSLAWSLNARKHPPLAGCAHKSCANCPRWALQWRARLLQGLAGPAAPG